MEDYYEAEDLSKAYRLIENEYVEFEETDVIKLAAKLYIIRKNEKMRMENAEHESTNYRNIAITCNWSIK